MSDGEEAPIMKAVAKWMSLALGLAAGVGLTGPALAQEAEGPILFKLIGICISALTYRF